MKNEEHFLLSILSDYCHERCSPKPDVEINWPDFLRMTQQHCLGGVVYFQCRKWISEFPDTAKILHNEFLADVFHYECRRADLDEVSEEFNRAQIPFAITKGMEIAKYHPVPELRSMGDIDFVIHSKDRQQSHKIMEQMGFRYFVDNHSVWTYMRDMVIYEIHDLMMYDPLANSFDYGSYFDSVWDNSVLKSGCRYELEPNFHFLYLLAHTAKHIVNKGCGIRAFLDIALMAQAENLDWEKIRNELEKMKLLQFGQVCMSLCSRWFDLDLPLSKGNYSEEFFVQATEKVLVDGVFGLENKTNEVGVPAREIRRSGLPYWISAIKITLRGLFPSYQNMLLIPWYSFVRGKPWLLPIAWIYRFFYCAKNKFVHSRELLERPFVKREEIETREDYISRWGL